MTYYSMTYYSWLMISNSLRKHSGFVSGYRLSDTVSPCNYSAKKSAEKVRECFTPLLSIAG